MPEADGGTATDAGAPGETASAARSTVDHVLAVARYEAGNRVRGTAVLFVLLAALAALDLALFPSIASSGVDLDAYMESMPPAMREAFGGASLGTIEGFLVAEFYQFGWVLALGMYVAYRAGGLLSGDVERDRMDLLLATPISRRAVVLGKFASLLPMILALNVLTPVVVLAGVPLIGESISTANVLAVHALSIPYLLACGAVGIAISAVVSTADVGRRAAMGVVFAMYLLDSVTARTDVEWVGALTFPNYYDSAPILTESSYDLSGAGVLLAVAAAFLAGAAWWFGRRDV